MVPEASVINSSLSFDQGKDCERWQREGAAEGGLRVSRPARRPPDPWEAMSEAVCLLC